MKPVGRLGASLLVLQATLASAEASHLPAAAPAFEWHPAPSLGPIFGHELQAAPPWHQPLRTRPAQAAPRGRAWWMPPATLRRIIVAHERCPTLYVERRALQLWPGLAPAELVAQTEITPQRVGAEAIADVVEPAGAGALWFVRCATEVPIATYRLAPRAARLAWELAAATLHGWRAALSLASTWPGRLPMLPSLPGDDGYARADLMARAWEAAEDGFDGPTQARLQAASAFHLTRLRHDAAYTQAAALTPPGPTRQVDDLPMGSWRAPWQLTVQGPARVHVEVRVPWHAATAAAAAVQLTLDDARPETRELPRAPSLSVPTDAALPSPSLPTWRELAWEVAVPPGVHRLTWQAVGQLDEAWIAATLTQPWPRLRDGAPWLWSELRTSRPRRHATPAAPEVALADLRGRALTGELAPSLLLRTLARPELPIEVKQVLVHDLALGAKDAARDALLPLRDALAAQAPFVDEALARALAPVQPTVAYALAAQAWRQAPWLRTFRTTYLRVHREAGSHPLLPVDAAAAPEWWLMPGKPGPVDALDELAAPPRATTRTLALWLDGAAAPAARERDLTVLAASDASRLAIVTLQFWQASSQAASVVRLRVDERRYELPAAANPATLELALAPGRHRITVETPTVTHGTVRGPLADDDISVRKRFWQLDTPRAFLAQGASVVFLEARARWQGHPSTHRITARCDNNHVATLHLTATAADATAVAEPPAGVPVGWQAAVPLSHGARLSLALPPRCETLELEGSALVAISAPGRAALEPALDADPPPSSPALDAVQDLWQLSKRLHTAQGDEQWQLRLQRASLLAQLGLWQAAWEDIATVSGPALPIAPAEARRSTISKLQAWQQAAFLPKTKTSLWRSGDVLAPPEAALAELNNPALRKALQSAVQTTRGPGTWPGKRVAVLRLLQADLPALNSYALRYALSAATDDEDMRRLAFLAVTALRNRPLPSRLADKQAAAALSQWRPIDAVEASASRETLFEDQGARLARLRSGAPEETLWRDALYGAPWPPGTFERLDDRRLFAASWQDAAVHAVAVACAKARCQLEVHIDNQAQTHVVEGGAPLVLPLPSTAGRHQLRIARAAASPPLAVRLETKTDQFIERPLPMHVATAEQPVQVTVLGPTVLQLTAAGYNSQPTTLDVTIGSAPAEPWPLLATPANGLRAAPPRTLAMGQPISHEIPITNLGPTKITLRPRGQGNAVAMALARRTLRTDAHEEAPLDTLRLAREARVASLDAVRLPSIPWPQPLVEAYWPRATIRTLAATVLYATQSTRDEAQLAEAGQDYFESDVARVEARVTGRLRHQRQPGTLFASLQGAVRDSDTHQGSQLATIGLQWRGAPTHLTRWLGALDGEATLGRGARTAAAAAEWMARARLAVTPRLAIGETLLATGQAAASWAHTPSGAAELGDPAIFNIYRATHASQLQLSAGLRWRWRADQQVALRAEHWSNDGWHGSDQLRLAMGLAGLVELGLVRGPLYSLRYQPAWRMADAHRLTAHWRHDLIAALRWPIGLERWGLGRATLQLTANWFALTAGAWQHSFTMALRWDFGPHGLLAYRPDELELADFQGATAWATP